MCVILPLTHHFLPLEPDLRHYCPAGEISAARLAARDRVSISMTKETTPLWVWLSLALLAIGTLAYVTTAFLFEYLIGLL